ncbi:MAG: UvrD-helicase domain-containing protein [Spirochaetaceae bacterium]|jgi:DNA helicase-2/ATP-dependent DNA helicase PcrA|nr:UvrD-helicase domain-containing protein [Spirochaetaceae bacterium]
MSAFQNEDQEEHRRGGGLTELNGPQLKAVSTLEGPVLIIAGAGSGKTRVITYRIAHMLKKGIPQSAILALTFTNKAAREMEKRIKELTGKKLQSLTISTFHAFGLKILREEIETLGYRKNFSIYDETDRGQLIRDCLRECRIAPDGVDTYSLGQLFSNIKTGRTLWIHEGGSGDDGFEKVYQEYQSSLRVFNALDFDDLLTLPITLFETYPEIREKYQKRCRYIMVDEFQDTNYTQYRFMKLLASPNSEGKCNVCVVGDDDQSIYSWRGADYGNILAFEKDFPGAEEIKLEQNYRSTTTILEAANGVIAHNTSRKDKKLWSGKGGGRPIVLAGPENESDEADFIASTIKGLMMEERLGYGDFGVLIRTNSMTRSIEEAFLERNIPYRVSGGTSFFQRKEIKDIISYLRVIANSNDDVNLLRIINTPRRGIGKTTIANLSELAKRNHSPLWDALNRVHISQTQHSKDIDEFMNLMDFLKSEFLVGKEIPGSWALSQKVRLLVDHIDYWSYLVSEYSKNEKIARWKFANIEYLIQSIEYWEKDPDNFDPTLYPYLNRISLITRDDGEGDADRGKVNLMTIHAAKGLEFPVVFIAGAEDGIMPHTRSIEDGSGETDPVEEERRLFYVALTRARDKLFISSCKKRRRLKDVIDCVPSPFLAEIPPHLVEAWEEEKAVSGEEEARDYFALIKNSFGKT